MSAARTTDRRLLRLAARIAGRLAPGAADQPGLQQLAEVAERGRRLERKAVLLRTAAGRGWRAAAADLQSEIVRDLGRLRDALQAAEDLVCDRHPPRPPSIAEVGRDLGQLFEELDDVRIDLKARTISALTHFITLQGVPLGRFRLVLHVRRLGPECGTECIDVEAQEPNPAGSDGEVTHPHVRSKRLCAGNGADAIAAALRGGRVCDAFVLVRSVLNTYAADSPYVALENWDGSACSDCGARRPSDELSYCESCGEDVCNDCCSFCRCCESTRCGGCLTDCSDCGERTCGRCLEDSECRTCRESRAECSTCGESVDCDDLVGEPGRCPDCRATPTPTEAPDDSTTTRAGGNPTDHPAAGSGAGRPQEAPPAPVADAA